MRRWEEVLEGYLANCRARGLCVGRVQAIRRELERLGCWLRSCQPVPRLEEISAEQIVDYIKARTQFRAKATVSDKMSTLRCLGRWLVQEKYWVKNPLEWMHGPKINPFSKVPCRLSQEAMTELWQAAATAPIAESRPLWLAILALLYGLGLRRGEVERLNVSDWEAPEGLLRVDGRKTRRQRSLAIMELVTRCLEAYLPLRQSRLEELGRKDQTALFVSRRGGRLSGPAICLGIKRLARRREVPLTRLHQFRHTCASDLLEAGVGLPEVQKMLGHADLLSTMRYLHFSGPQRRAAIARHPLNDRLSQGGAA